MYAIRASSALSKSFKLSSTLLISSQLIRKNLLPPLSCLWRSLVEEQQEEQEKLSGLPLVFEATKYNYSFFIQKIFRTMAWVWNSRPSHGIFLFSLNFFSIWPHSWICLLLFRISFWLALFCCSSFIRLHCWEKQHLLRKQTKKQTKIVYHLKSFNRPKLFLSGICKVEGTKQLESIKKKCCD